MTVCLLEDTRLSMACVKYCPVVWLGADQSDLAVGDVHYIPEKLASHIHIPTCTCFPKDPPRSKYICTTAWLDKATINIVAK